MDIAPLNYVFEATEEFKILAKKEGEQLSVLKEQCLLYLTQGYYAALTNGEKFIPSVFFATDMGPIEPNSYYFYASPKNFVFNENIVSKTSLIFIDTVWKKFGNYSGQYLQKMIFEQTPFVNSFVKGQKKEINIKEMASYFLKKENESDSNLIKDQQLSGIRITRNQLGQTVKVKKWLPKQK